MRRICVLTLIAIAASNAATRQEREVHLRELLKKTETDCRSDHPELAQCMVFFSKALDEKVIMSSVDKVVDKETLCFETEYEEPLHPDDYLRNESSNRSAGRKYYFPMAEAMILHGLEISREALGADESGMDGCLSDLAFVLRKFDLESEAAISLRAALTMSEKTLGLEHLVVATRSYNLGRQLDEMSGYEDFEMRQRFDLETGLRKYGADNPSMILMKNQLAGWLEKHSKNPEAELLYRRSLEITVRNLGTGHPLFISRSCCLASLLYRVGRLDESEVHYRAAVDSAEKVFGKTDDRTAACLNHLAGLYDVSERYAEAGPLYMKALSIIEQNNGLDHPAVALCLYNIAGMLADSGHAKSAEPILKRALEINIKRLGEWHAVTEEFRMTWRKLEAIIEEGPQNRMGKLRRIVPSM